MNHSHRQTSRSVLSITTVIFIFIVSIRDASAQQVNLDSLMEVWNDETLPDTSRLQALEKIAWDVYVYTQPDSAYYYAQVLYDFAESKEIGIHMSSALHTQGTVLRIKGEYKEANEYLLRALEISKEIEDKRGLSKVYNSIGIVSEFLGDFDKALDYYTLSLKFSEEIENKRGTAYTFSNIGIVYQYRGDLAKAIDYYSRALKIHEEIGNQNGIAISSNNIGLIYEDMGDYPKALHYYHRCLEIAEEQGTLQEVATSLTNIGIIYEAQGEYAKALDYHTRSLETSLEIDYKYGTASALNNIGIIHHLQNNPAKAIDYCSRSLKLSQEIGNKDGIAYSLNTLAMSYNRQGNYAKAVEHSTRALDIANDIGSILKIRTAARNLYKAYQQLGNYRASLEMHELFISIRDSLDNIDGQKAVITEEFERQLFADSLAFAKQKEVDELEYQTALKEEASQRFVMLAAFVVILIFIGIYFRLRTIKRGAEKETLLQEIKLLKIEGVIKTASNDEWKELLVLDKEKIEKAIENTLNISDWSILQALFNNPAIGNVQIADQVALSVPGVRSSLQKMYRFFKIDKSSNQRMLLVMEATKISNNSFSEK
ncbi:MAG: tetratricopeptide repeat protein [Cyclobacteriaceae bacterium]